MINAYASPEKKSVNALPEVVDIPDSGLQVRLIAPGDIKALMELTADPEVQRYIPWAKHVTDEQSAEDWIGRFGKQWERGEFARYVITDQTGVCGYFGVWCDSKPD